MKLGLVARADDSGLGIQTYEFYRHMKPDKTLVVDIGHLNGNPSYPERYPDGTVIKGFPKASDIDSFLQGLDVVFVAETPYNYHLFKRARQMGVKVAQQYNLEFLDYETYPHLPKPDLLIAPSKWNYDYVENLAKHWDIRHVYLHCPVNRAEVPFRKRTRAKNFLHLVGKPAAHDRNGTKTVIEASKLVKSDNIRITLHFQSDQRLAHQATHSFEYYWDYAETCGSIHNLIFQQFDYEKYSHIYDEADVLLLPRRYGGNCLPLNEALSSGMPTIMTDVSPNNVLLPPRWLIPSRKIAQFTPRTTVDIYEGNALELAKKIDWLAGLNEKDMAFESATAGSIAEHISWSELKPKYLKVFEELCQKSPINQ